MTASSVDKNITDEHGGKYDTAMVPLLLLLLDAGVFLMLFYAARFLKSVLNFIVTVIEKCANIICTIIYLCKISMYNFESRIQVIVTVHTYFWTDKTL